MKKILILMVLLSAAVAAFADELDPKLLKRAQAGDAEAQFYVGAYYIGKERDFGLGCGWIFLSKDPNGIRDCFASGITEAQLKSSMAIVMSEAYAVVVETGDAEKGAQIVDDVIKNIDNVMKSK